MEPIASVLFCPLAEHDNPAAARRVADFADRNRADVTVLGIVPERSRLSELIHGRDVKGRILEAERDLLEKKLRRCAPPGSTSRMVVGNRALSIIQEVLAGHYDLVVITADEDDHATVKRLLRKCPCPVWVIRPSRAKVHRLLAAVNPDPAEAELNHELLQLSMMMNTVYGGELHVVHAWELYGEATMRESSFIRPSADQLDEMLAQEEAVHREALDGLLGHRDRDKADWTVHVLKGPPSSVVPDLIRRKRINLLLMGTVARSGLSGLLMGNTAERIIDEVRCSVIAVKPPGFVSPIHEVAS